MKVDLVTKKAAVISLTPLIDIVFILLVFFMLVTNLTQFSSVKLNLNPDDEEVLEIKSSSIIDIKKNGDLYHNQKKVALEELSSIIEERISSNSKHVFFVQPESSATLDQTLSILDLVAQFGPQNFSLLQDNIN
jgi:biopolymer transport protein ExbD